MTIGWREGRNPSRGFDVAYYLRGNPDVAATGMNPLVHYVWSGAGEGRQPRRALDTLRTELERARPPRVQAGDWTAGASTAPALDRSRLGRVLAEAITGRGDLVVSASHDDYDRNIGGVQNMIRDERRAAELEGFVYLHLSPASPLPMLADPVRAEEFRFSLRVGSGTPVVAGAADLVACLATLRDGGRRLSLVVHHFRGHAPEVLLALAEAATERTIVWLHDYLTLCPNQNLLRNDIRFCGAPPVGSGACGICVYGTERIGHMARLRAFFEVVQPLVLAPSEAALDFWRDKSDFPYRKAGVQSLARLVFAPEPPGLPFDTPTRPLRVAHLGMRTLAKGWFVFEELALRFAGDPSYAFYQLGASYGAPLPGCVRNVQVHVGREKPEAMLESLAEHRIDAVVSWSLWPETFCFTVHEALAAGAFVLARGDSGNVPRALAENAPGQGRVLESEAALFGLFEEGGLRDMICSAHRRRGVLIAESGSVAWLRRPVTEGGDRLRAPPPADGALADA